jgi:hypothetical protein
MKIYQLDDTIFKHIIGFMNDGDMSKVITTISKFVCTQLPPLSLNSKGDTAKSVHKELILHHYMDKIDLLTSHML